MPNRSSFLARSAAIAVLGAGCASGPIAGSASPDPDARPSGAQALYGPEWVVEDIDGRGIIDRSRVTFNFAPDGHVWGRASCNSYRATFATEGDRLTISRAISTRMACAPALMQQESRFLAILTGTHRFAISADGALTLQSSGAGTIRARLERASWPLPR